MAKKLKETPAQVDAQTKKANTFWLKLGVTMLALAGCLYFFVTYFIGIIMFALLSVLVVALNYEYAVKVLAWLNIIKVKVEK